MHLYLYLAENDFSLAASSFLDSFIFQERDNYWKMMQKYIGADVQSLVTLPVFISEPNSVLQRMAEVCVFWIATVLQFSCSFIFSFYVRRIL